MSDTYTAAAAARVLGISERRVRQLAAAGALEVVSERPLKIGMQSIHDERDKRRTAPVEAPEASAGFLSIEQVVELAERLSVTFSQRALEAAESALQQQQRQAQQVEDALKHELAQARAEVAELKAQLGTRSALPNPVEAVRGLLRWRP